MIEWLLGLDRTVFLSMNSFHFSALDKLMIFFSGQIIWLPILGLALWNAYKFFDRKIFWLFILFLLMTLIISDVTSSYIIKNLADRLRPCRELDLKELIYQFGQKCGGKYGFVSSHAANSLALVVFTMLTINFKNKWTRLFWFMPFIVSFSRIYLGSHYPGDILGGFVVGGFSGLIFAWFFRELDANAPNPEKFSHS